MTDEVYDDLPRVAKVLDSGKLVLNVGRADEVSVGDNFLIFSLGEEILDPVTNESLGRLEIIKGRGKVDHLQDRLCTIRPIQIERRVPKQGLAAALGAYDTENIHTKFENAEFGDFAKRY